MEKYTVLKLIGLAILTMATLILLSFIEVAIYSYFINPGHEVGIYESHAQDSAPYISGIFGFIIFFLVARYWTKKDYPNVFKLILLFPVIYILLDILILVIAGFRDISSYILIFLLSNGAKFLGSFLGYKLSGLKAGNL